ncbi:MAG: SDR family oxidoreductase [Candidatus Glassbacteria bacterium]|nr:SDR family oxidoreductase [Candidatus Glassbacteria bacterium]
MKCLITGGAGFIGSNLAAYLVAKNWQVRVLDNLSTGKQENLDPVAGRADFIEGDIRDAGLLDKVLKGCAVVFHQAALPSVPRSIAEPELSHDVNVNGTLNLLLAARRSGVGRVILASSSSVYGDSEVFPRIEDQIPMPLSPYAVAKLAGENYARVFATVYGMETVCLRYFNIFGPRQDPDSAYSAVIPRFIKALSNGEAPVIYGDGLQSRDFTYVDHVSEVNYLAATAPGPWRGEILNVGCGRNITLLEVLETLKRIKKCKTVKPRFEPPRTGDVRNSLASIDKAHKLLNFKPESDFTTELARTLSWFELNSERIPRGLPRGKRANIKKSEIL